MSELDAGAERALRRLRDDDSEALRALARMVVHETTATPIRDLASPRWIASQVATALEAATSGDRLHDAVGGRLDRGRDRWATEERPLREFVPDEVQPPLRKLLGRPFTPSEGLTRRIVRQDAVRDLMASALEDSIRRFGKRARAADESMGGMGRRAAARGRSLGKGLFAAAGVADVASSLLHTVSDEVEHSLDKRIKDFLGEATSRSLEQVARQLSDPEYAETFAGFRLALLEEVLDTPLQDLVAEADNLGPADALDVVLEGVRAELQRDGFIDRVEERIGAALDEAGDGTLGAWLDEVDLREVWVDTTTQLVTRRLRAVVDTEAFEAWWVALHGA